MNSDCEDSQKSDSRRHGTRDSLSLKARAVGYLSRREYSRLELQKKLRRYLKEFETEDDLQSVLDDLEQKGYLSDERFAKSRVRVRSNRYGNMRLAYELKNNGVSADLSNSAIEELGVSEYDRAKQLWQKRFGEAPSDFKERAKQMRYLLARGFSMETARRVVQFDDFDE